ncbi:MAG: hypothetical protein KAS72_09035 [Phycisphaerales bacterium]|nr:hypothetical protein [Phycisphaerales bacterium]
MNLDDAKALIIDINKTVTKLDEAVRARAFEILTDIAFDGVPGTPPGKKKKKSPTSTSPGNGKSGGATDDLGEFISKSGQDKPSDNVKLLVAWLYSQYGKYSMSMDSIRELADESGLTLPNRIDMTIKSAKDKGKLLFRSTKRSHYQLTTQGELYVKQTYNVGKGTKPREAEDDE